MKKENITEVCTYCDKFAYTNYRDIKWNLYRLCVDHVVLIKEKEFLPLSKQNTNENFERKS